MGALLGTARRASDALVALLLFLMMTVTCVDVFGRYLLHRPLAGSSEMIRYMLALVIFLSLPSITALNRHISISILDGVLPLSAEGWRMRFVNVISAMAMVVVGYYMWRYADVLLQNRDVIGASLLPLAPAGYAVSTLSMVTGLAFFVRAWRGAS